MRILAKTDDLHVFIMSSIHFNYIIQTKNEFIKARNFGIFNAVFDEVYGGRKSASEVRQTTKWCLSTGRR